MSDNDIIFRNGQLVQHINPDNKNTSEISYFPYTTFNNVFKDELSIGKESLTNVFEKQFGDYHISLGKGTKVGEVVDEKSAKKNFYGISIGLNVESKGTVKENEKISIPISIGNNLTNLSNNSIALGTDLILPEGLSNSIAIGAYNSKELGAGKSMIGINSDDSISIGYNSVIGDNCPDSITMGKSYIWNGQNNIALGGAISFEGNNNVIVGNSEVVQKIKWSKNSVNYQVGEKIYYNNAKYIVIKEHKSNSDLTPDKAEDLFKIIGKNIEDGYQTATRGNNNIAIGFNATIGCVIDIEKETMSKANNAIQLGTGLNNFSDTFQVFDYQMLNEFGKIPNERLSFFNTNNKIDKNKISIPLYQIYSGKNGPSTDVENPEEGAIYFWLA